MSFKQCQVKGTPTLSIKHSAHAEVHAQVLKKRLGRDIFKRLPYSKGLSFINLICLSVWPTAAKKIKLKGFY